MTSFQEESERIRFSKLESKRITHAGEIITLGQFFDCPPGGASRPEQLGGWGGGGVRGGVGLRVGLGVG